MNDELIPQTDAISAAEGEQPVMAPSGFPKKGKGSLIRGRIEKREPIVRIVKRENVGPLAGIAIRAAAFGTALLIILLFLSNVTKSSFGDLWKLLWDGAFGAQGSVNQFLINTAMLLGIALALAPAFKMKFWNIGAQGQVLIGALFAAIAMQYFAGAMRSSSSVFLMFLLCIGAGGLWALIPAFFKIKINANETLFTLMMNYVAIQIVKGCVTIWQGKKSGLGIINSETSFGYLPSLFDNPYGLSILLVSLIAAVMFIYMRKSKHGYEISVVGESLNTARYAGINTKKVILRTMFLSGAICGLVGMFYVAGVDHTISTTTSGSYGFTAIIVAWAAKFNPIAMAAIALIIVFFERGSAGVCNNFSDLNSYTGYIVVGIFLFLLIGCEFFINYKMVPNSKIAAFYAKLKSAVDRKIPWLGAFLSGASSAIRNINEKIRLRWNRFSDGIDRFISDASDKAVVLFKKAAIKLKAAVKGNALIACRDAYLRVTADDERFAQDGAAAEAVNGTVDKEAESNE